LAVCRLLRRKGKKSVIFLLGVGSFALLKFSQNLFAKENFSETTKLFFRKTKIEKSNKLLFRFADFAVNR
jgi:hypothetical protein